MRNRVERAPGFIPGAHQVFRTTTWLLTEEALPFLDGPSDSSASSRSQLVAASTSAAFACHVQLPSATPGTFMRLVAQEYIVCSGTTPRHSRRQWCGARCRARARRPSRHRCPQAAGAPARQGSGVMRACIDQGRTLLGVNLRQVRPGRQTARCSCRARPSRQ